MFGKVHMLSLSFLRDVPSVAFGTVLKLVQLTMALSRPFQGGRQGLIIIIIIIILIIIIVIMDIWHA